VQIDAQNGLICTKEMSVQTGGHLIKILLCF